jgi:hypothetical protein
VKGHGNKLSRKHEQAVAALLRFPTISAAAESISVNERTLREWLKLPDFAAAFRDARRQVVEQAIAHLQQLTGKATDALDAALGSAGVSDQIRAATLILNHAIKGIDTADVLARLEEMEQQLAKLVKGKTDDEVDPEEDGADRGSHPAADAGPPPEAGP